MEFAGRPQQSVSRQALGIGKRTRVDLERAAGACPLFFSTAFLTSFEGGPKQGLPSSC
jgi:hypothetical protein